MINWNQEIGRTAVLVVYAATVALVGAAFAAVFTDVGQKKPIGPHGYKKD